MPRNSPTEERYWLTRDLLLRGLGVIYFFVFLPLTQQFTGLLGEQGLLPISVYLEHIREYFAVQQFSPTQAMWRVPTLFWFSQSNLFGLAFAYTGLALAVAVIAGYANGVMMLVLWLLQLSLMHVGQDFWSFGWESNLLEIGFLGIFLPPMLRCQLFSYEHAPAKILFLLYRWVMFRLMFGAGMIKVRYDECWRDFTCLQYHFETQPIPNPVSPLLHTLPPVLLKSGVFINHVVEIGLPWLLLAPHPIRNIVALVFVLFQIGIAISGNYAWINLIATVMAIPCFDDRFIARLYPRRMRDLVPAVGGCMGLRRKLVLTVLACLVVYLSYEPARNLFSRNQVMNTSYDQFHLVNSYGVFGSVTRERYEVVLSGSRDTTLTADTTWEEYEFPCKPGDVLQRPCVAAPYHYRITWQIWFAAMSNIQEHPWLLHLAYKLLRGEPAAVGLLSKNPFPDESPRFVKADLYLYRFTKPGAGPTWYQRDYVSTYFAPLSLQNTHFVDFIQRNWPEQNHHEGVDP